MSTSHLLVFGQFFSLGLLMLPFGVTYIEYGNYFSITCNSIALLLAFWIFMHNRLGNFNIIPDIKEGCTLIQSGPYKYIRHPMYSAVTLFALSTLSFFAIWKIVVVLTLTGILYLKAKREENFWCEKTAEYKAYQLKSKMFIPYIL